jgi:hypothetical protein
MRAIATVAAVAAVWLLSGCGNDQAKAPASSPAFTISGTITLSAAISTDTSTVTQIGNPCTPDAGYEDIATGAQVTMSRPGESGGFVWCQPASAKRVR